MPILTASSRCSTVSPAPRPPRGTIVVLGCLAAIGPLSGDTYLPALPQIADEFSAEAVGVQLTLTASLFGLALGQLLMGPLSDLWGRRRLLLGGLAAYTLVSAACAMSTSLPMLTGLRFLQGLSGAAAVVLARAVVQDLWTGSAAARALSHVLLVFGIAPVVAPLLGSAVLGLTSWRGIFAVLSAAGAVLFVVVWARLGETLPPERRTDGGLRQLPRVLATVLQDRVFLAHALACGLAFGGMFAYLAGSPFVIQQLYGASATTYAALFAVNALGIALAGQINARLVVRIAPARLLGFGLVLHAAGALCLLAAVTVGRQHGLAALLPPMFVVIASLGLIHPNATALALARFPRSAGSASSVLGAMHFAIGASISPLVGLGGADTAVPLGAVIAATATAALLLHLCRPERPVRASRHPAEESA
jgi:DHA1 family bicyclomycin/chloramphenicol resistance-like MFS transporter